MEKFLDINLIATVCLATAYPIITKFAVSKVHPDYASVIATVPWMIGLMIIASFQLKTEPLNITLNSMIPLLILGSLGAIMTFFGYRATANLPVNYVVIARAVTPALSILLSYFVFGDKLTFGQWMGILMILLGAIMIGVFKEVEG